VTGPSDVVPGLPPAEFAVDERTAAGLYAGLLRRDFDPARSALPTVDHSVVVPLHFLNPGRIPVVPIYLNGMVTPLPNSSRCRTLGSAIRAALADLPQARAAVIASGSFSLEVGGPRADPDLGYGIPDEPWAAEVAQALRTRDIAALAAKATPERLAGAGTVAGELLPWLTAAEAASDLGTVTVDHREGEGHAFAAWW
jgi:protocatechuate 4,5-dioxygenase beta chain